MELRTYNVQRVYKEVVKAVVQDKVGVNEMKISPSIFHR